MARTKEFDPDAVLDRALDLFWRRGYEATSMADLVEALGIARASIYGTFGSKHDLYLAALGRYQRARDDQVLDALSRPGPALPAVRALVTEFAEQAAGDDLRRGCFVTNTAVELAPHDTAAARRVEASWDALEAGLTSALLRARAQGELAAGRDPRGLARMLLVLLQGIRVVGKAGGDADRARDAAAQALTLLD
ncbi:TetR/AcrR family transcriptional regulator [Streptomyces sp. NBC_00448]|uniref:TetR/AcrR family transcriptional regulator n=1 Tax=Streptomyces sp. NBC_00448 TaxID=2903652 RepID=UPI002E1B5BAA